MVEVQKAVDSILNSDIGRSCLRDITVLISNTPIEKINSVMSTLIGTQIFKYTNAQTQLIPYIDSKIYTPKNSQSIPSNSSKSFQSIAPPKIIKGNIYFNSNDPVISGCFPSKYPPPTNTSVNVLGKPFLMPDNLTNVEKEGLLRHIADHIVGDTNADHFYDMAGKKFFISFHLGFIGPIVTVEQYKQYLRFSNIKVNFKEFTRGIINNLYIPDDKLPPNIKQYVINARQKIFLDTLKANAIVTGASSAVLSGIFNVNLLFEGEFAEYFTKIAIQSGSNVAIETGLNTAAYWCPTGSEKILTYGGPILNISFNLIKDSFYAFDNDDWERVCKNLGLNVASAATAAGGAIAGAKTGTAISILYPPAAPLLIGGCTIVGGVAGALGGRWIGGLIPFLGGLTEMEFVDCIYKRMNEILDPAGLQVKPGLSKSELQKSQLPILLKDSVQMSMVAIPSAEIIKNIISPESLKSISSVALALSPNNPIEGLKMIKHSLSNIRAKA